MRKYAVIGLGRFGSTVASSLFESGVEVMVIEKNQAKLDEMQGKFSVSRNIDCTNEYALKGTPITEMDAVILAIGDIETSILTGVILKKIGVAKIYAKVDSSLHSRILELLGINNIYFPEEQMGKQLARVLLSPNVIDYQAISKKYYTASIIVPPEYVGKTLQELNLPNERNIHIVAIKRQIFSINEDGDNIFDEEMNVMPGANDVVEEGDTMMLIGSELALNSLLKEFSIDEEDKQ